MTTATKPATGDENFHPDDTDRALLRCVQLAPRAPFRRYGEVLGLAEQTVARRYRRVAETRLVRVAGVLNTVVTGQATWFVRLHCAPHATRDIADVMARRPDTSWVFVADGTDVLCSLRAPAVAGGGIAGPTLQGLPMSGSVLTTSASMALRRFAGGTRGRDSDLAAYLTDEQEAALTETGALDVSPAPLTDPDIAIVCALQADGRASYAQLAKAAGLSESAATRRTHALLAREIVTIETDLAPELVGRPVRAQLWITVAPRDVARCGRELAALPSVAFAAAMSGRHNLLAWLECRSTDALYDVLSTEVAAVEGITGTELVVSTALVKQAGALPDGVTPRRAGAR